MLWLRNQRLIRLWLVALYALSMAVVGFAHTSVPRSGQTSNVDLAAYALPDGSLPTICFNPATGDGDKPSAMAAPCDACLLTSAAGLPPCRGANVAPVVPAEALVFAAAETTFRPVHIAHVLHLRGPPLPISAI